MNSDVSKLMSILNILEQEEQYIFKNSILFIEKFTKRDGEESAMKLTEVSFTSHFVRFRYLAHCDSYFTDKIPINTYLDWKYSLKDVKNGE